MLRNSQGFTFIEVLVSCVILGVGLWGTMNVVSFANRTEAVKTKSSRKEAVVYNLMQDLRKRPEILQKNFTGVSATSLLANPATFPIAWDIEQNAQDVATCPLCRGRIAYVVQPITGYSDFMLATIRICPDYNVTTTCETYKMYMVAK